MSPGNLYGRHVGCQAGAVAHFSAYFCPTAAAMEQQTRRKLSSPGPLFAATPSTAQTPGAVSKANTAARSAEVFP
jgi:hypothetical protein